MGVKRIEYARSNTHGALELKGRTMTQQNEQDAKKWEEERTMSFLKSHLTDFFNERLKEFDEQEARKSGDEPVTK
jgi:hypothetical protein